MEWWPAMAVVGPAACASNRQDLWMKIF